MPSKPTIFVQIASYRDPECQWTVKDLFAKAEHPERVTAGICWQCFPEHDQDCFVEPSPRPEQTRIVSFLPSESFGVCWARAKTQTLFEDQDYVLMIDSHMRFIPNWDTALIAELKRCPSPKSFISTYPPGYKPPDQLEQNPRPVVMRSKDFTSLGDIRFEGETLGGKTPEKPLRGAFLAGGFMFAPGKFVREVPYDPHIYFDQEEITLAARAFTHGWDVFSPTGTYVYHYYYEPNKGEARNLHWKDNRDLDKIRAISRARYEYLLSEVQPKNPSEALVEIEKYGLGKARTLKDFEDFSGLDFKKKVASERARKSGFIEGLDRYRRAAVPVPPPGTSGKSGLAPLTPLEAGDFVPPFQMRDETDNWREMQRFAGKPCFLCILPGSFDVYNREFFALYREKLEKFRALGFLCIFIAPVAFGELSEFRKRNDTPQGVLADEGFGLCHALGIADKVYNTPFSYALDANQKIISRHSNSNAHNHVHDLLREAEKLKAVFSEAPARPPVYAPVFVVPGVLPDSLRSKILAMQGVEIQDKQLLTEIDISLGKRLFPEIRKNFALDVACRERYKVGVYASDDKGFYPVQRDTGGPEQAHRRVSVSFSLNDDFEGGSLLLPEYGQQACFRVPAGSALCYPSTALHTVTPVTKGRALVMTSCLFGVAEESWRKKCCDVDKKKYDPDDVALLSEKTYPGLLYSQNFYTRNGVS